MGSKYKWMNDDVNLYLSQNVILWNFYPVCNDEKMELPFDSNETTLAAFLSELVLNMNGRMMMSTLIALKMSSAEFFSLYAER